MLLADEGTAHGTWRIKGNQFFTTASVGPSDPAKYTIVLITKKDFVIADESSASSMRLVSNRADDRA